MKIPEKFYYIETGKKSDSMMMVWLEDESGRTDWLCGFECLDDAYAMMDEALRDGALQKPCAVVRAGVKDIGWRGVTGLRYKRALADEPVYLAVKEQNEDDPYCYA